MISSPKSQLAGRLVSLQKIQQKHSLETTFRIIRTNQFIEIANIKSYIFWSYPQNFIWNIFQVNQVSTPRTKQTYRALRGLWPWIHNFIVLVLLNSQNDKFDGERSQNIERYSVRWYIWISTLDYYSFRVLSSSDTLEDSIREVDEWVRYDAPLS